MLNAFVFLIDELWGFTHDYAVLNATQLVMVLVMQLSEKHQLLALLHAHELLDLDNGFSQVVITVKEHDFPKLEQGRNLKTENILGPTGGLFGQIFAAGGGEIFFSEKDLHPQV